MVKLNLDDVDVFEKGDVIINMYYSKDGSSKIKTTKYILRLFCVFILIIFLVS